MRRERVSERARDHIWGDFVVAEVKECFRCDLRHRLWGWLAWRLLALGVMVEFGLCFVRGEQVVFN